MYPKTVECPRTKLGGEDPRHHSFYEGVELNMSVLRKRSRWILPAACLLLGALSLGLTGCGGDDTPFPPEQFTPLPIVPPVDQTASNPTSVVANQAATILTTSDPTTTTGVTLVKIEIPTNSVGETTTLAAEVVPSNQGVIVRSQGQVPNFPAGVSPVSEIAFGTVAQNNMIDVKRPIVFASPIQVTIQLTPEQINTIQSSLNSGNVLHVRVLGSTGDTLVFLPNPNAILSGNTITFTTTAQGEYVITLDSIHQQGEVG